MVLSLYKRSVRASQMWGHRVHTQGAANSLSAVIQHQYRLNAGVGAPHCEEMLRQGALAYDVLATALQDRRSWERQLLVNVSHLFKGAGG